MTDKPARDTDKETPETFATALLKMQKAGLGPMQWLGAAWLESMGEIGSELSQFVAERIREDVKTQHELLHCRDPEKLRDIQSRFLQTAFDQYTAETGKLVEMQQGMVERMTNPPKH